MNKCTNRRKHLVGKVRIEITRNKQNRYFVTLSSLRRLEKQAFHCFLPGHLRPVWHRSFIEPMHFSESPTLNDSSYKDLIAGALIYMTQMTHFYCTWLISIASTPVLSIETMHKRNSLWKSFADTAGYCNKNVEVKQLKKKKHNSFVDKPIFANAQTFFLFYIFLFLPNTTY